MGKRKTAKITKGVGVKDITLRAGRSVKGGAWYAKFDGVDGSLKAGASEVLYETVTVVAKPPAGSR